MSQAAEAKEEVFNTFPDKTDSEVRRIAIVAKAQVWQAIGELVRRGTFVKSSGTTEKDPTAIERGLEGALDVVLLTGFLTGQFDSEHDLLQNIIDNGGELRLSEEASSV